MEQGVRDRTWRLLMESGGFWRSHLPSVRLLGSVIASRSALGLPSYLNGVADNKLTDVAPSDQCTMGDQLSLR